MSLLRVCGRSRHLHTSTTHPRPFMPHTVSIPSPPQSVQVLRYDGKGHDSFPFPFELRSIVSLGEKTLTQELRVTNTGM